MGTLSFYVMWCFYCTGEFLNFILEDRPDNLKWFDIKLLIDINNGDTTVEMQNNWNSQHIKAMLKKIEIMYEKLLHLGCNLGLKIIDLLEEETEAIYWMGNWNNSVWDVSYALKLWLALLQKLAGFFAKNKMHFNTRTVAFLDKEVLEAMPIGKCGI
jgi:hypothetical protein